MPSLKWEYCISVKMSGLGQLMRLRLTLSYLVMTTPYSWGPYLPPPCLILVTAEKPGGEWGCLSVSPALLLGN